MECSALTFGAWDHGRRAIPGAEGVLPRLAAGKRRERDSNSRGSLRFRRVPSRCPHAAIAAHNLPPFHGVSDRPLPVFTTGGWAWANIENTHCSSITGICGGIGPGNGVSSSNNGWYAGGGFDYVVHKGALVDMLFGVEYQHFDVNGARAFCVRPGCAPPAVRDFDLSATGDLVRARLTVKTQGFFLVR